MRGSKTSTYGDLRNDSRHDIVSDFTIEKTRSAHEINRLAVTSEADFSKKFRPNAPKPDNRKDQIQ